MCSLYHLSVQKCFCDEWEKQAVNVIPKFILTKTWGNHTYGKERYVPISLKVWAQWAVSLHGFEIAIKRLLHNRRTVLNLCYQRFGTFSNEKAIFPLYAEPCLYCKTFYENESPYVHRAHVLLCNSSSSSIICGPEGTEWLSLCTVDGIKHTRAVCETCQNGFYGVTQRVVHPGRASLQSAENRGE